MIKHRNDFTSRFCCTGVCRDSPVDISQTATGEKVQNNYAICVTWVTSNVSLPVDTNFSPSSLDLGCAQLLYPRTARDC